VDLDYGEVGLKVGLEIHQELKTHKLFCRCPSALQEEDPSLVVKRRLRPTQSEMGEIDRAALAETLKGKFFRYQVHPGSVCLVELDEEPPHPVSEEVLDAALEICLLLNAKPVDEIHTMRKIVIDGSNTAGFQRTALIATDGFVEVDGRKYTIKTICLEEDAARKMGESRDSVDYRLDRLGIPLVEVATGAEFSDPETPAKVALYIGQLMRATGKVKRGLGTIRQDINISIAGGARQEIKGIQELALIPEVIRREVQRQLGLLKLRDELKRRGLREVQPEFTDVSEAFAGTACKVIKNALSRRGRVLALKIQGAAGLIGMELQPGRRFGTELADRAKLYGKVGGIFHSDEMPAYGITPEEVEKLREILNATPQDAIIFVVDEPSKANAALAAVAERLNQALRGVPEETRRALPDGNTEFMRPLPGAARMYPETDIPPVPVSPKRLRKIKANLPEPPEQKLERYQKEYRLGSELAERLISSGRDFLFEELVKKTGAEPKLVAVTLTETLVSLRRDGVSTEKVTDESLQELFAQVATRKLAKEAIPDVLVKLARGMSFSEAVRELEISVVSKDELAQLVQQLIREHEGLVRERGERALKPLMGLVMREVRGKVDGKLVHQVLERELRRFLKERQPS